MRVGVLTQNSTGVILFDTYCISNNIPKCYKVVYTRCDFLVKFSFYRCAE